jgi:uncharacterized protein (DUF433 family)
MTSRYIEDITIRQVRVRTWVRAVRLASGLSLIELEKQFSDPKAKVKTPRSCIWDKYARGDVAPRIGKNPNGKLHLASRIDKAYPGTLRWLNSPMWRLIDKAPMSMIEIKAIYDGMPYLFKSIFVEPTHKTKGLFWRRYVELQPCIETLYKMEELQAFIALLTMVKEAEVKQDQETHYEALKAAISFEDVLAVFPELDFTDEEIIDYLEKRFKTAGYYDI